MAISTSSYFSNSIVGLPQVAGEGVDVYATDTAPKFAIGTKFERQDGCVFRYAHFAAACTAGQVMASAASDTGYCTLSSSIISTSSTYQVPVEPVGVYPNGIGSRYILIQTATASISAAANQYAGGYITIGAHKNDGVYVAGQTYRIRGNLVPTVSGASSLLRFSLYDKLIATIPTSAFITVAGNRHNDLAPADDTVANALSVPAGVAMNVQAAGNFGWVQTRGPAGVQLDANATGTSAGYIAVLGTGNLGSVLAVAGLMTSTGAIVNGIPYIGVVMAASSANQTTIVDLKIE